MTMAVDMKTIRAEPRRKILIVMMSCVAAWCLSVQHQFNGNLLLIEFYPSRTIVCRIVWVLLCYPQKHSRFLSDERLHRQLNLGSDRACSFCKFNKHRTPARLIFRWNRWSFVDSKRSPPCTIRSYNWLAFRLKSIHWYVWRCSQLKIEMEIEVWLLIITSLSCMLRIITRVISDCSAIKLVCMMFGNC